MRFRRFCSHGGTGMKIFRSKKHLLAFFMPGFLLGIVYVNFVAKKYVAEPGIFSDYFLEQFQNTRIDAREFIWYLLRLRVLPFLVLAGVSLTKMRKIGAVLFLVWTGLSGGILISTAVLSLGIKGSILCIAGVFPQFVFYIPGYLVLIWYCYNYPQNRWNRQKTIFVILMLAVGIILEMYVNPSLVRIFLKTF